MTYPNKHATRSESTMLKGDLRRQLSRSLNLTVLEIGVSTAINISLSYLVLSMFDRNLNLNINSSPAKPF